MFFESVTLKTVNGANVLSSAEYSYTYDSLGNILTVSKDGALVESYEYDSLNQLTRENNATAGFTKLYYYDASGNITKKVEFGYTTAATSSLNISDGTVTSYTYGATNSWKDLLTDFNGTALTYDEIGNPLNWHNAETLTWEQRELQKVNFTANAYVNYSYNSSGIRTGREYVDPRIYTRSEHDYVLDGSKIIKEHIYVATITSITNIDLYYVYDASGEVIGLHYNNALYYFQKNLQGDVVGIVDTAGTVVVEYTYDAWGKVLTTTGSLASTVGKYNPFRYRSYYYDTETGWYYLNSRYYDPSVCRFISPDKYISTGQGILGHNMFAYCGNNPVVRYDTDGLFWKKIIPEFVKEVVRGVIDTAHEILVDAGIDTAAIGATLLCMQDDNNDGVYHVNFWCWQMIGGYNSVYDSFFDFATSMQTLECPFTCGDQGYTIWAWKADYINLGAGGELAIYSGNSGHRTVDEDLAMGMVLSLEYKGENIAYYFPDEPQWWITAFNSNYLGVEAIDLKVTVTIVFSDGDMFNAFHKQYEEDPNWEFYCWYKSARLTF